MLCPVKAMDQQPIIMEEKAVEEKAVVASGKNLGPRGLLSLWSQVRAMWLLI
jgi:hypothetical protein